MLKAIQIRNYVLIDNLEITFREGFSVMTGQTGAGKSIILGALNLLMGQRADTRIISDGADKCTVEGHFDITGYGLEQLFEEYGLDYDETDTIFRREVTRSGKSRAFINDTPISLSQLKEIGCRLIDIHSQHQNLQLGTETFQTMVTDTIADNRKILDDYRSNYRECSELQTRLEILRNEVQEGLREQEYLQFQLDELEKARLSENEQQELESEQDILSHAEEIKEALFQTSGMLENESGGIIATLRQALQSMRIAARNMPAAAELSARLESCLIELRDISSCTSKAEDEVSFDPGRLDAVTERLDLLYSLQKKHHCESVKELIEYAGELRSKLDRLSSGDEEIASLEKQIFSISANLKTLSAKITETRIKAADKIGKEVCSTLIPLGIPGVRFKVDISPREIPDGNGADHVRFLFSANQGSQLQELSAVASGGELSRVMLAVKSLLAGIRELPTIVFDEIDTGVSGAVAERMALMMRSMCSEGRQVIAITHLPQIAAKGDTHYLVYKTGDSRAAHTGIAELDKEQRVKEIAQMISGATITEAALDNARILIES
ncbi:MAG: DNA repair protein RecN [Bacteroidaceae bacterium]|nr:DNA repair protein RecN [Bacteroidaceae bacterium]